MKKTYIRPELELQVLNVLDVITYSIEGGEDPAKDDVIDDYVADGE